MENTPNKREISPTVQHPAARWAFVLVLCAALGVVVSYYWRVFYGLDTRGLAPLVVTGFCVGLAVLAGAAALLSYWYARFVMDPINKLAAVTKPLLPSKDPAQEKKEAKDPEEHKDRTVISTRRGRI